MQEQLCATAPQKTEAKNPPEMYTAVYAGFSLKQQFWTKVCNKWRKPAVFHEPRSVVGEKMFSGFARNSFQK